MVKKGNKFITVYGNEVPASKVVELEKPYRGYKAYERYTDKQIATLKELIDFLCDRYGIDSSYNKGMWDVSKDALNGKSGIWSHTSYRSDKSDCFPQKELIEALCGCEKKTKKTAATKKSGKLKTETSKAPAKKEVSKNKKDAKK